MQYPFGTPVEVLHTKVLFASTYQVLTLACLQSIVLKGLGNVRPLLAIDYRICK